MRKPKRPSLLRAPDAFFPLAMALCCALRPDRLSPVNLCVASLAVACLSLFASRGTRIAFARQPSIRHVRGSVKVALLLTLSGGALAAAGSALFLKGEWPLAGPMIAAVCLLNIEHIFYEYMYAIGDRNSARLARGLTAILTAAGLLLSTAQPLWLVGMTGLAALVALVIGLVMGDGGKGRPDATVLRVAPRAALQTALYPAAAMGAILLLRPERYAFAFFAGLALYELCKTPFRRSPAEARAFNRALLGIAAVCALGVAPFALGLVTYARFPDVPATCGAVLLAAACAFALFGNVKKDV